MDSIQQVPKSRVPKAAPLSAFPPVQKRKVYPLLLFIIVVLLIAGGVTAYFWKKAHTNAQATAPDKLTQSDIQKIVERVGKLIVLPEDEIPTLATVADPEKLKAQPFFLHAKTGDQVLIYTQSKRAILYDPVANRIVEVGSVNSATSQTVSPEPSTKKGTR